MTTKQEAQRELRRRRDRAELERRRAGQPSIATDMLRSAGAGLRSGAEIAVGSLGDVGNLNAAGASWLARKLGVSPETAGTIGSATKLLMPGMGTAPTTEDVRGVTDPAFGPGYEPQTTAGKYTRTATEFLPAAALGSGRFGTRIATQALLPGVASEAAGQATEGTTYEPYARVAAALLTPLGLSGARRIATPFPASQERLRQADTLANEGVDLTAGQRTGSEKLRYMESELGGNRGQRMMEQQAEQFTRAALRRAGIEAPRATPEVMDQAFTRIGNEFDTLANKTSIPFDQRLQNDLLEAATDYQAMTGESARAPLIENLMNDAAQLARAGTLDGAAYARLRTRITDGIRRGDSNTRGALQDMREALDDAVERSLPQRTVERWKTARNQYRNMLVLEQAATGAGENAAAGLISPSALRNATVTKHGRRNYARGEGDFADLARSGEATMKPLPNSGTAQRLKSQFGGASLSGVVGALLGNTAMPGVGTIAGGLAGAALPAIAGRAMLSGPGRAYLGNQLAGSGDNPTMRALIAALLAERGNAGRSEGGAPAIAP